MHLSTKHKLSLSIALAVYLCAPISTYANSGGSPGGLFAEWYVGEYVQGGATGDANGANVFVDSNAYTHTDGQQYTIEIVYGGVNDGIGNANNNTVRIVPVSDFDLSKGVYGGLANNGDASGNSVEIRNDNNVKIEVRDIFGGAARVNGNANSNRVSISSATVEWVIGGDTYNGVAAANSVEILAGTTVTGEVRGGSSQAGAVRDNKVTIAGDNIEVTGNVCGGYSAGDGIAENNIVTIRTGEVSGDIYGGYSNKGAASGNKVIISGGTQSGWIIGGRSNNGSANNNSVTIEGAANLTSTVELYGGRGVQSSGNKLNIYKSGVSVSKVSDFQYYDLVMALSNETTLTVDQDLALNPGDKITSTRVLSEMNVGDTAKLLASNGTLTVSQDNLVNGTAKQGILYKYGYELRVENGKLLADIKSKEKNIQATSVADGQLAAMGMLRSGADLVASVAMDNAAKANTEYDTFAAMNYTNISMNSVSSVDVQGSSMLVGMGRNIAHDNSNLTIGAFLEAGWGTYESSLGLAHAKGHTNYYGVGVLARNNANSGVYTEGSLRVGKVGNTYSGRTIEDGTYDVSSTYYGLHLGIGKINQINETISTDIYAKYFYAHEGGTDANIAGDKFNFDSIDSHRVRIGGRLNSLNKNINRYVGLAYEYEFSGKATASVHGSELAAPTAKGSSGILELGLVYKPTTDSKFSMDMGMNGYVGKRKGVTGNVTLNWGF